MGDYNSSRYTTSRDRLAELRNNGGSDSTDAFGPDRVPGRNSPTTITTRYETSSYELQERTSSVSPIAKTDITTMEGFLAEVDDISSSIKLVQSNIDLISELHDSSLVSINESQWKQNSKQLSRIVDDTSNMNTHIKNRIKALETSNARHLQNSNLNIRRAQVGRIKKDFITCIQRYRDVEGAFSKKYRQRVERQVRIVKQDVTDEELDAIIDSDQQNQIFAQSLLQNNRSGQAKAVLSEVQTRHDDIKKIEKTILELAQLFQDMQMMVEEQGQIFDQIEQNAEDTSKDVEQGVKHVNRAVVLARSTRAKKWCCFFITIILCVVIAILVWWFAFGHPGVGGSSKSDSSSNTITTVTATATATVSAIATASAGASTTSAISN